MKTTNPVDELVIGQFEGQDNIVPSGYYVRRIQLVALSGRQLSIALLDPFLWHFQDILAEFGLFDEFIQCKFHRVVKVDTVLGVPLEITILRVIVEVGAIVVEHIGFSHDSSVIED